ncbi:SRPBCC family protein [Mycolicibacillus parakoreensis]|uniref:SRPBCC family protein n=1 Tax=Mycolicibacillus parakoreensis TaxID=1069221 RepID=A0ABY3U5U2_9MYCO|nr:SRPBCC family protein [Mycolicibacillus parakoreensis]MCV7317453.1 SRPBCC family protein [Mycolicibacillus parakoreensis]ULN53926.1 SRPBCC family protein [Mycolicibacillus parakoreensis]
MAKVQLSSEVPMSAPMAWERIADLSALGDWLVLHEAWRGQVPTELTAGTQIEGVAGVKGMRNRVRWTITEYDPPARLALSGAGKGGTRYSLTFTVAPAAAGATLGLRLDLGGAPLFGPVGAAAARAVKGDLERSLRNFVALHS